MTKVKIAAVSYLNTVPFIHGIRRSGVLPEAELVLAPPAGCADLLKKGKADIGLVPAAELPNLPDFSPVGRYCIGSNAKVRSVVLLSDAGLPDLSRIYLDDHSRTSVQLVKILAGEYWKIDPEWLSLEGDRRFEKEPGAGYTLIGDKVFTYENRFARTYDLAEEWNKWTGLPFVFAVWVARHGLSSSTVEKLDRALGFGVDRIEEAVREDGRMDPKLSVEYLTTNLDFRYTADKATALGLFLRKSEKMRAGARAASLLASNGRKE